MEGMDRGAGGGGWIREGRRGEKPDIITAHIRMFKNLKSL